jgi:hypothetical protein
MLTSHTLRAFSSLVAVLDLVGRNACGFEGQGHGEGKVVDQPCDTTVLRHVACYLASSAVRTRRPKTGTVP